MEHFLVIIIEFEGQADASPQDQGDIRTMSRICALSPVSLGRTTSDRGHGHFVEHPGIVVVDAVEVDIGPLLEFLHCCGHRRDTIRLVRMCLNPSSYNSSTLTEPVE